MKRYSMIALAMGIAIAGCKDNPASPPIDAPSSDGLSTLTRVTLQKLLIGVTAQDRLSFAGNGSIILPEIYARDVYRIDASESRYVTETLGGNPDPGSFAGGSGFAGYYTAIRAENNTLLALNSAPASQFTPAEVAATRGFLRTMKALDYYRLVETRDTVGIPLQSDDKDEVLPVRCKPGVLSYIAALLDSANADFTTAGATTKLPSPTATGPLPTGFSAFGRDYNVVSNLVLFNRGLKGKVDFYRALDRTSPQPALFATAIAELTQALEGAAPGTVTAAQQVKGIYYKFDPVGDQFANPISDAKIGLNPKVADSVQAGDTRASKIVPRATLTGNGISTSITYSGAVASAANQARPVSLIRDEELVLLRAQAEIENNQLALALLDVNSVRTTYGLTAIAAFADKASAIRAVLYEKRFSFLFEGPQRLVDLRAYGFLNAAHFAPELSSDPFNSAFPIPRAEQNARGGSVVGCTA
jgi:hypothetical protein